MESLMLNALVGFVTILFGAMAIFPMLIDRNPASTRVEVTEDQILSIQPVAPASNLRHLPGASAPAASPSQRHAA